LKYIFFFFFFFLKFKPNDMDFIHYTLWGGESFFQRTEIQSAIAPSSSNSYVNSKR
jgi:hypothetical protein